MGVLFVNTPGATERVGGHVVDAVIDEGAEQRDTGRDELEVCAHVGEEIHPHRRDAAVAVGRQLDLLDHPAAVDRGHGVFGAVLGPAHGSLQALCDREADGLLRVHIELRPETATDGRRNDTHLVLSETEHHRELDLEDVRDLGRRVDGDVAAVRLRDDAHAAWFHCHRDQPLVHVSLAHRVDGFGKGALDRILVGLELPHVRDIGPELRMHQGVVVYGGFQLERGRQFVVLHDHGFHRVTRGSRTLGDHDCDSVSHKTHFGEGERVVLRVLHVRGDRPSTRERRLPVVTEIGARVHRDDSGHRPGGVGVDRSDRRVGVRAPYQLDVQRTGDGEVVDEACLTTEQHPVLAAQLPSADDGHRPPPAAASTAFTMFW